MSRREFLYYIWAASMALFLAETGGAILWFAVPRFKAGEFGGVFELDVAEVPPADSGPVSYDAGRFWLVNIGQGNIDRQYTDYPETKTTTRRRRGQGAYKSASTWAACTNGCPPTTGSSARATAPNTCRPACGLTDRPAATSMSLS
jgi:hypothetical protein